MAFVYIVPCNFNEPSQEQAWNNWYSGAKIAQMLRKPHFRTCQRFKRMSGSGRDYLALWTLQSPDAFKTEQYTSDWGFFEWVPPHHRLGLRPVRWRGRVRNGFRGAAGRRA